MKFLSEVGRFYLGRTSFLKKSGRGAERRAGQDEMRQKIGAVERSAAR